MRAKARGVGQTERQRQIIRVATELFSRQGFKGTTTRQIAQQARIKEAIIFRQFPHKEYLDWTIIDQQCRSLRVRKNLVDNFQAESDVHEAFAFVAEEMLDRNAEGMALSRLLLFAALENHRLSDFRTKGPGSRKRSALTPLPACHGRRGGSCEAEGRGQGRHSDLCGMKAAES